MSDDDESTNRFSTSYSCLFRNKKYYVNRVQSLYRILQVEGVITRKCFLVHIEPKTRKKFFLLDHNDFDGYFMLNNQGKGFTFELVQEDPPEQLFSKITENNDLQIDTLQQYSQCTVFLDEFGEKNLGVALFCNWIVDKHKAIIKRSKKVTLVNDLSLQ